ncbi:hypothetical protein [Neisseria arctica]|nr:hypothetical protein [Neisseria arctica]UOO87652.1 hypothetical protein LVJ86_05245 [Neisseria arctica]
MNLYNLVFRDLEELLNEDAAIKFALSCLIENERFTELEELLREQSCLGGVEGEPGWLIERRNLHDQNGYEHWPQEAQLIKMTETDIRTLFAALSNFKNLHANWSGLLTYWIGRADGFMELMTFEDGSETPPFLIEKLTQILADLPSTACDDDLIHALSQDFEILFFRAQYGPDIWNSTQESLSRFIRRHEMKLPNLIVLDQPHEEAGKTAAWLRALLYCE